MFPANYLGIGLKTDASKNINLRIFFQFNSKVLATAAKLSIMLLFVYWLK